MTGRPRSFDRDAALQQALLAFWERGYAATSVAHLTQRMGITAPSLYAAFRDKETLFQEAAAVYGERLDHQVALDLAAPNARAAVQALLRSAAAAFTASGTPRGCLVMGEPLLAQRRAATRAALSARLARAVTKGELRDSGEAAELSAYLDAVLAGLEARARDGASSDDLGRAVTRAMAAWPPTMVDDPCGTTAPSGAELQH